MLKTNSLDQKTITDGAVKAVSVVAGMMTGGAAENVLPESVKKYADPGLAITGGTIAVMVKDNSTTGTVVKYAGLGMATRSLYEVIKKQFQKAIPAKAEGEELSMVDKLVQGAVGLSNPAASAYLASPTIDFDRYQEIETQTPNLQVEGASLIG